MLGPPPTPCPAQPTPPLFVPRSALFPYESCVFYTVVLAVLSLDRTTLKAQVGGVGEGSVCKGRRWLQLRVCADGAPAVPHHPRGAGVSWECLWAEGPERGSVWGEEAGVP